MSSPITIPSSHAKLLSASMLLPLAFLAGAAIVCEASGLDLLASDLFFDSTLHGFPMRKDWVYSRILHEGGKFLILSVAISAFLGFAISFRWNRLCSVRWPLLYISLCIAVTSALVGILKHSTNRYCPWDMQRYGGKVPYTTLLDGTPDPFTNGHGWPAGHAAPAFALCCLYIIARARHASYPACWLLPSVVMGGFFAWVQHVRGAHFLSHNLWSAMISWLVALLLAHTFTLIGFRLGHESRSG